jgi:sugar lactone lactonase YvrE
LTPVHDNKIYDGDAPFSISSRYRVGVLTRSEPEKFSEAAMLPTLNAVETIPFSETPVDIYSLAIDKTKNIWITDHDTPKKLVKIGPSGKMQVNRLGLITPRGIAFGADGSAFVVDSDHSVACVYKISPSGDKTLSWGGFGKAPGFFQKPRSIAVDSKGNVVVLDSGNYRIQKFDGEGKFVSLWTLYQPNRNRPDSMAFAEGRLYVAGDGKITVYSEDGKVLLSWKLAKQHGRTMIAAHQHKIFALEGDFLSVFSDSGKILSEHDYSAIIPESLAVDANGDLYLASTFGYLLRFENNKL